MTCLSDAIKIDGKIASANILRFSKSPGMPTFLTVLLPIVCVF